MVDRQEDRIKMGPIQMSVMTVNDTSGREKTVNGKAPNQYTWNVSCLNTGGNGIGMI